MSRISWERYAIELAKVAATRSEDPYRKVGAVVLRTDYSVAGIGYNGAPTGINIDWSNRDERRAKAIHAEANALRYCTPYTCLFIAVTTLPCPNCLTLIASYGIKLVIYDVLYETDTSALEVAKSLSIELRQIDRVEKTRPPLRLEPFRDFSPDEIIDMY